MRSINLKSISAGPEGVMRPGRHSVPADHAAELVKGGHAEYADRGPVEIADARPTARKAKPPKGADE